MKNFLARRVMTVGALRRYAAVISIAFLASACGGGSGSGGGGGNGSGNGDSVSPPPGSEGGQQNEQFSLADVRSRFVAWYPIAHTAVDPANRNVGRGIPEYGWAPFVNHVVIPQTSSRGIYRVQLHNPFGRRRGNPPPLFEPAAAFQFDQFLEAQADGLSGLTEDFVAAWLPVTGMGYEVIGYIGTPFLDPDSQRLLAAGELQAFDARAADAIAPILQAGMSIAFDAAVVTGSQSADLQLAEQLRSQGKTVYVEAGPRVTHTWWFDFPIISRDDTWRERLDNAKFAPPALLTGEILRIARTQPEWGALGSDEWPQEVCEIIAEGDTAVVEASLLRDPNRQLSTLKDCADALLSQG